MNRWTPAYGLEESRAGGICERCDEPWCGDDETGGCETVLLARRVIALGGELAALRERAERSEVDRDGYRDALRDTLALVDDRNALLDARVAERVAAEARVERLEGRIAAAFAIVDAEAASGNTAAVIADVRAALANGKPR